MCLLLLWAGARVGLATEVRECLQVQWQDESDPSKGLRYLYLQPEDYQRLSAAGNSLKVGGRLDEIL